jgi:hypothetical protein
LISIKARAGASAMMDREETRAAGHLCRYPCQRQAFSACLDVARARGAERIICLGDIVGYGADPEWAVDTVMDLVADGAVAVMGNHDNAVSTPSESMNAVAQAAIEWTRGRLSAPQRHLLTELPLTRREDDRLYVHAEASHPARWHYVRDSRTPRAALRRPMPTSPSADTSTAGALFDVICTVTVARSAGGAGLGNEGAKG